MIVETEKHRIDRLFVRKGDETTYESLTSISDSLELDESKVEVFLRIGYVPGTGTLFRGVDCLPGGRRIEVHEKGWDVTSVHKFRSDVDYDRPVDDLVRDAAELWMTAVDDRFDPRAYNVVPLSGGLDSRGILAALLELTAASNLRTYTYGVPGSNDFEYGNVLAREAGTRHTSFDTAQFELTEEKLLQTARLTDANTDLFQPVVWIDVIDTFGENAVFWTGFTGDTIAGSHYIPPGRPPEEAIVDFLEHAGEGLRYSDRISPLDVDYIPFETKYDDILSKHEAIWYESHIERYTTHHLFLDGLQYAVPYMDDEVVQFFMGLPDHLRTEKTFFNRMMSETFPRLFSLPTTDHGFAFSGRTARQRLWRLGQLARRAAWRLGAPTAHPGAAYFDYMESIRSRPDFRPIVRENLERLKARSIVDPNRVDQLWTWADSRARNRTSASTGLTLTLLASLELSLRAFDA